MGNAPNIRHGQARSGQVSQKWLAWHNMRRRASEARAGYEHITVDPAWESFEVFDAYMPDPPSPLHSLDRIRGAEGYWPGNVRWATKRQQSQNRRTTRWIEHDGRVMCAAAWARELGVTRQAINGRLRRSGSLLGVQGVQGVPHG